METLTTFLEQHGYWLVAGVGFAEYAGLPIASVPVLVAAGALAAEAGIHPIGIAVVAAAGGLVADGAWFGIARWQGARIVGSACGLTSNPNACVIGVRNRVERLGPRYILTAKFVPGAGNLIAPGAGLARIGASRFLALDAIALMLWATLYVTLGVVFSEQVEAVVAIVAGYARWALIAAVVVVVAAGAWRVVRARGHDHRHDHRGDGDGEGEGTADRKEVTAPPVAT